MGTGNKYENRSVSDQEAVFLITFDISRLISLVNIELFHVLVLSNTAQSVPSGNRFIMAEVPANDPVLHQ